MYVSQVTFTSAIGVKTHLLKESTCSEMVKVFKVLFTKENKVLEHIIIPMETFTQEDGRTTSRQEKAEWIIRTEIVMREIGLLARKMVEGYIAMQMGPFTKEILLTERSKDSVSLHS